MLAGSKGCSKVDHRKVILAPMHTTPSKSKCVCHQSASNVYRKISKYSMMPELHCPILLSDCCQKAVMLLIQDQWTPFKESHCASNESNLVSLGGLNTFSCTGYLQAHIEFQNVSSKSPPLSTFIQNLQTCRTTQIPLSAPSTSKYNGISSKLLAFKKSL